MGQVTWSHWNGGCCLPTKHSQTVSHIPKISVRTGLFNAMAPTICIQQSSLVPLEHVLQEADCFLNSQTAVHTSALLKILCCLGDRNCKHNCNWKKVQRKEVELATGSRGNKPVTNKEHKARSPCFKEQRGFKLISLSVTPPIRPGMLTSQVWSELDRSSSGVKQQRWTHPSNM